jgi:hypothetical protein
MEAHTQQRTAIVSSYGISERESESSGKAKKIEQTEGKWSSKEGRMEKRRLR